MSGLLGRFVPSIMETPPSRGEGPLVLSKRTAGPDADLASGKRLDVMTGIIVGVDGSESAAQALQWADREAALRKLPVTAVLAWGFLDQHHPDLDDRFDPSYGETAASHALDAYVERALGPDRSGGVRRRTICDLPSAALLETSRDASLLVVGARGLGGFRELLLGSVSHACVHHAASPVAVVRGEHTAPEAGTVERVVVGIDGSETARHALAWAVEEARLRPARLEVVHAWHMPYVTGYPWVSPTFDLDAFEEAAQRTVAVALGAVDTDGLVEPITRTLCAGGAASALLDAAKGADLVVVGSRGLGGFTGLLLGSVGDQVVHHADCPVVVVPPEAVRHDIH
jgi:nucleotide-binding universal stress UspA family protein